MRRALPLKPIEHFCNKHSLRIIFRLLHGFGPSCPSKRLSSKPSKPKPVHEVSEPNGKPFATLNIHNSNVSIQLIDGSRNSLGEDRRRSENNSRHESDVATSQSNTCASHSRSCGRVTLPDKLDYEAKMEHRHSLPRQKKQLPKNYLADQGAPAVSKRPTVQVGWFRVIQLTSRIIGIICDGGSCGFEVANADNRLAHPRKSVW